MAKEKRELTEYNLTFVGATSNQAQAIQGVIQAIVELKTKDEMPIKKYQDEIDKFETDLALFKDTEKALAIVKGSQKLLNRLNDRIEYYEKEIAERELKIDNHKANLKFIDDYIIKIQSYITEEIDHKNKMVTYTYDMSYLEGFLDLALIVFEMEIDDEKVS